MPLGTPICKTLAQTLIIKKIMQDWPYNCKTVLIMMIMNNKISNSGICCTEDSWDCVLDSCTNKIR